MSALAKFLPGASSRVKKFTAALAASDARLVRLSDTLAEVAARFVEDADAAPLRAAEEALAREQAERAALVRGLETAQKAERAEDEAQAARETEARHARLRVEAEGVGREIVEALVTLGRLLGRHEALVDQLPPGERFQHWPPAYCEAASKQLTANVKPRTITQESLRGVPFEIVTAARTREVEVRLTVPLA